MSDTEECIFCKIISNEIPSEKIYEDDQFICIRDLYPQAKVHLLLIPKEHLRSLAAAFPEDGPQKSALFGNLFEKATKIARSRGLLPDGFRTVMNVEAGGGQSVFHIHLHILGGGLQERFA